MDCHDVQHSTSSVSSPNCLKLVFEQTPELLASWWPLAAQPPFNESEVLASVWPVAAEAPAACAVMCTEKWHWQAWNFCHVVVS